MTETKALPTVSTTAIHSKSNLERKMAFRLEAQMGSRLEQNLEAPLAVRLARNLAAPTAAALAASLDRMSATPSARMFGEKLSGIVVETSDNCCIRPVNL